MHLTKCYILCRLFEGHFLFLGPTAQIGRFIARSATQLCNHAGLGLGRHAMNLKELHLGPRPRAAALTRRATSSFRRVGIPRGSRENHETKNTTHTKQASKQAWLLACLLACTHTNTTSYQCPKKTQKWYLPLKYREIDNTVSRATIGRPRGGSAWRSTRSRSCITPYRSDDLR